MTKTKHLKSVYTVEQIGEMVAKVAEVADQLKVRNIDVYYAAVAISTSGLIKVKLKRDLKGKDD